MNYEELAINFFNEFSALLDRKDVEYKEFIKDKQEELECLMLTLKFYDKDIKLNSASMGINYVLRDLEQVYSSKSIRVEDKTLFAKKVINIYNSMYETIMNGIKLSSFKRLMKKAVLPAYIEESLELIDDSDSEAVVVKKTEKGIDNPEMLKKCTEWFLTFMANDFENPKEMKAYNANFVIFAAKSIAYTLEYLEEEGYGLKGLYDYINEIKAWPEVKELVQKYMVKLAELKISEKHR